LKLDLLVLSLFILGGVTFVGVFCVGCGLVLKRELGEGEGEGEGVRLKNCLRWRKPMMFVLLRNILLL